METEPTEQELLPCPKDALDAAWCVVKQHLFIQDADPETRPISQKAMQTILVRALDAAWNTRKQFHRSDSVPAESDFSAQRVEKLTLQQALEKALEALKYIKGAEPLLPSSRVITEGAITAIERALAEQKTWSVSDRYRAYKQACLIWCEQPREAIMSDEWWFNRGFDAVINAVKE